MPGMGFPLGAPLGSGVAIDYAYSSDVVPNTPVAIIAPASQDTIVGAVVRVDGRASISPTGIDLTYIWTFAQVPIGSQVALSGFKDLEGDNSAVSFAPDVIGLYVVQLVVSDGTSTSGPAQSEVNTKVVLVPQNLGIVPDVSWVWNMLSDFWGRVEQRQRFETVWSSAVQIIAAEQLKLWQYDYNKSIQDIQEVIQKRWIKYEPALTIDPTLTTFILADDQAGLSASTFLIDPTTMGAQANQPALSNLVTVPASEGSFSRAAYGQAIAAGRLLELDQQSFTMSRTGVATRAVNQGVDGSVSGGGNDFHGSAFSAGMVGMTLKILTGPAVGSYTITTVTSSILMVVKNLDGSTVSFPTSPTGLKYSIFSSSPDYSSFFADQLAVPTQQLGLPWRFSPTLVSTQYDFEAQGVSPGDVLVVQITRVDNQRASNINVQVVSVDRNRIGVVFNTADLVAGVASLSLSQSDQIQLANDLQVTGLSISQADGSLSYSDQALSIKKIVQSAAFKRQFFETALSSTSTINVGPFSVTVTPFQVIRNSKILVDSTTKSIPSLQEYVKQPSIVEQNGALFQVSEGNLYPLARQPYNVFENTDYVLDAEDGISGTCSVTSGSALVQVPYGDLLDRGVRQGDTLNLTENDVVTSYQVLAIVDAQTVRVAPIPAFTDGAAPFTITRAVTGSFIRFVSGTFTKKKPAPARLWAEVTFFDNGSAVENNFGVLVGVLRSDLSSVGATISYKNAVAGLMYALTNGPTLANLQLSAEILLGLPFTTTAGTVIEIDPVFKTNLDGSPFQGRILIAAEDSKGNSTGITNIFFYPLGKQTLVNGVWEPVNPDLSGLAINPTTGVAYAVGDHVDSFTALSKGVQIQDYLTTSSLNASALSQGNTAFSIQQYHSFQMSVNADITTAIDTDLVAQFIKKAKPTYVKLALALSEDLDDEVTVDDSILFNRDIGFLDNESFSMPTAVTFDQQDLDGSSFISVEGQMYAYRITGTDLVTAQSGYAVTSATGGFVTAGAHQSHDINFLRPGYLLQIIGGPNNGSYLISSVNSDTQVTLSSTDLDGSSFVFQTQTGQEFAIYMPITGEIARGSCNVVNGAATITTTFGLGSTGVTVGDLVVMFSAVPTFSRLYRVKGVTPGSETLSVTPNIAEASGAYTVVVYREGLLTRRFGHPASATPLSITTTASSSAIALGTASSDVAVGLLAFPGDLLIVPSTGDEYVIFDFDPVSKSFYVSPAPSGSATVLAALERVGRGDTPVSMDILDRMPGDSLFLGIRRTSTGSGGSGPDLTTTASSASISTVSGINFDTGLGVVPGDYLMVLEGADSTRDIGYGAGIFPILSVSGTTATLTRPLTVTNASPGILYGIQRRSSNER